MGVLSTFGIFCLVALPLLMGFMHVQNPGQVSGMVLKGNFPTLLNKAQIPKYVPGFKFGENQAKILVQAVGGVMACASLMIVVNLGRSFFAFVLAMMILAITVCQHMDINDPAKTPQLEMINALKNLGIVGGLLRVAGAGGYRAAVPPQTQPQKVKVA